MDLEKMQNNIDVKFNNVELLKRALVHTSYAYENKTKSNEKLEFLGDAVLEFVISKYLYSTYKNLTEGEMTKVRASVVCEESLYTIAVRHNFSDFLYMGRSEINMRGNLKPAILADSVEAVIAAIYLDSGLEVVQKFILDNLSEAVKLATKNVGLKDYKTVLQEKLQENGDVDIKYTVVKEEGPDHNKKFTIELSCNNQKLSIGSGTSKKNAEMEAAKMALEKLSN